MPSSQLELQGERFLLRPQQRQLLLDGAPAKLGARAFDMLQMLVEQRERSVSKAELLARIWNGRVVQENNLEVHVWALRKLLGTDAIATIPGRGYRFTMALAGDAPALAPEPAPRLRSNLPRRLTPLIGRPGELDSLVRLLAEHPLVTLVGAGGIGKTLLAQHVLHRQRDMRMHGVCWVDLAPLPRADTVVPTIAAAMGLSLRGTDPAQALCAAMAPLSLLLGLDNAEGHADEVARVAAALVDEAPGLVLLVTSQVPLKLARECVYRVDALAVPADDVPPADVLGYGAVALFVDRVHRPQRRFQLDTLSTPEVAAVCRITRALDGNPLAIELAASRVPLLGVRRVADSLDDRLALLSVGWRDVPARHRSLRAVLEWSHSLLSATEQCVLRRLAVFVGSFSLDRALEVVPDEHGIDRWSAIDALDALVERSLVVVQDDGRETRYRLPESPAAFARECLADDSEAAALRARHARAVLQYFVRRFADLSDGRMRHDDLIDELDHDLDNARAAFGWALERDGALAVSLARPLGFALTNARPAEVEAVYGAALERLHLAVDPADRLACVLGASIGFGSQNVDQVLPLATQAVTLARAVGDARSLARALGRLASLRGTQSAGERRAALDEMLALVRPDWPAIAHMYAAEAERSWAYHEGDLDRVEHALRRWLESAETTGSHANVEAVQLNLADLAMARDRHDEAVRLGRELEQRWQGSRQVRMLATARLNLAAALLTCDRVAQARAVAERGWPMAAAWRLQAPWAVSLALLAAREDRPQAAARLLGYGCERLRAIGNSYEPNEERIRQQAETLVRERVDAASFDALVVEGAALADAQVAGLAFGAAAAAG